MTVDQLVYLVVDGIGVGVFLAAWASLVPRWFAPRRNSSPDEPEPRPTRTPAEKQKRLRRLPGAITRLRRTKPN
jgi:hypothetical protein